MGSDEIEALGAFVCDTGWVQLMRSDSSARFSFKLSGNSNNSMDLLLYPLIFDQIINRFERKLRIKRKIRINRVRINRT